MLPPLSYLSWAQRFYPGLRFDLASSGLAPLPSAELGAPDFAPDDPRAFAAYRAAVGAHFGVPEGEVAPALGTSGAFFAVYHALFEAGDQILVEQPTYEPLVRVAEGAGLVVRRFARARGDQFALRLEAVEAALSPRTRAVVVTDLHNPSGVAADHAELARIARRLDQQGAYLVVDEVYAELAGRGRTARTLGPNVVTLSSLTKTCGLWWARCGFALLPERAQEGAARAVLHAAGSLPPSLAAYGAAGFARVDALRRRRLALQAGKRQRVDAFLARHAGVLSWVPPHQDSLFGFVRDERGADLRPGLEAAAAELSVLAAPGVFFDEPSAFRLGWTLPDERLDEGLERLARALGLPS